MSLEHYADKFLNPPSFKINDRVKPWQDVHLPHAIVYAGQECIVVTVHSYPRRLVGVLTCGVDNLISFHTLECWLLEKIG